MSELTTYKTNRINALRRTYNTNLAKITVTYNANVRSIQLSRNTNIVKQQQIRALTTQYSTTVSALQVELNKNIQAIQSFVPTNINISKNSKALLVGINYVGTENELSGCIQDITDIKNRISNKFSSDNIVLLLEKNATKANILQTFTDLLRNSVSGDLLFFAYSGHGSYTLDLNRDETTGYDQCICPVDMDFIIDDELKAIIQTNLKQGVTLFAMFDSCFSGSVLDLRYQYMDSLNYDNFTENSAELETNGNVFMISGCTDYQTSADAFINGKNNGAMTWSLLNALTQQPNCTWRQLVKNMRTSLRTNGYSQIPQFSSGNFKNIDTNVFI